MKVPILNKSQNPLPKYETEGAAGMDIRAMLNEPVRLLPGDRALIPTGLHIQLPHVTSLKCGDGSEIPVAFEADVRGRSGNFKNWASPFISAPSTTTIVVMSVYS